MEAQNKSLFSTHLDLWIESYQSYRGAKGKGGEVWSSFWTWVQAPLPMFTGRQSLRMAPNDPHPSRHSPPPVIFTARVISSQLYQHWSPWDQEHMAGEMMYHCWDQVIKRLWLCLGIPPSSLSLSPLPLGSLCMGEGSCYIVNSSRRGPNYKE